jgi:NAD(P)-dependent dehydrogenase (short-subunit alcohol dehydrogenase family)
LVNDVGLARVQPLGEVDLDDFDAVIRVNLHSALQATQAVLPGMRQRPEPSRLEDHSAGSPSPSHHSNWIRSPRRPRKAKI